MYFSHTIVKNHYTSVVCTSVNRIRYKRVQCQCMNSFE